HGGEKPAPRSGQAQPGEPRKMAAPMTASAPGPAPVAVAPEPAASASVAAPSRPTAEPLVAPIPSVNLIAPTPVLPPAPASTPIPIAPAADVTGSVKPPMNIAPLAPSPVAAAVAQASQSSADKLPASIGGPALRAAAASGNP